MGESIPAASPVDKSAAAQSSAASLAALNAVRTRPSLDLENVGITVENMPAISNVQTSEITKIVASEIPRCDLIRPVTEFMFGTSICKLVRMASAITEDLSLLPMSCYEDT